MAYSSLNLILCFSYEISESFSEYDEVSTRLSSHSDSVPYLFWVTRHTTQLQHNKSWAVEFAKLCYTGFLRHTLGYFSGGL